MNSHNVYVHTDLRSGTPFYVGKGRGGQCKRAKETVARSALWKSVAAQADIDVFIVADGLTEDAAFELESFLISEIGRMDLGLGPLINRTDGGLGMTGYLTPVETRQKISRSLKKVCNSAQWKSRQSKAKRQLWDKSEHREKYLGSNNCNAKSVICLDTGEVFGSISDAARAYGATPRGNMIPRVCKGKAKTAMGLRWAYADEAEK